MQGEICFTNFRMEMLAVIHMMAALALTEANSLMIPKDSSVSGNGVRVVSTGLASSSNFCFDVCYKPYNSLSHSNRSKERCS